MREEWLATAAADVHVDELVTHQLCRSSAALPCTAFSQRRLGRGFAASCSDGFNPERNLKLRRNNRHG